MYADSEADAEEFLKIVDVAFGIKHKKAVEALKKVWREPTA